MFQELIPLLKTISILIGLLTGISDRKDECTERTEQDGKEGKEAVRNIKQLFLHKTYVHMGNVVMQDNAD